MRVPTAADVSMASPGRRIGLRRAFVTTSTVLLALTALVGFAHTPLGRPLLAFMPGMADAAGCPVIANVDPRQVEKFRIAQQKKRRGERAAGGVPALDFELGRTTRAEVDSWIAARGAPCKSERAETVVRCVDVRPATATADPAAPIDDLHLQFDGSGRLVAADVQRRGFAGAPAVAYLETLAAKLGRIVGPPTKSSGTRDAAYLDEHPFARVEVEYRYHDYLAQLSVTSFGRGDVRVREQYQWLPPGS